MNISRRQHVYTNSPMAYLTYNGKITTTKEALYFLEQLGIYNLLKQHWLITWTQSNW